MKITGAELFVKALKEEKVDTLFYFFWFYKNITHYCHLWLHY